MVYVFAVPVFFICFRECLESTIIVSVLLSFLKQTLGAPGQDPAVYKKLRRQIWWGIAAGLAICLVLGGAFIGIFYGLGNDYFSNTEDLWEGIFSLIASIVITIMGAALLRVSKLQEKWRLKLARSLEAKDQKRTFSRGSFKKLGEKYAMFLLPFVTVLREGLEAVVFIGGVSLGISATAFPLAVVCGLGAGILVGFLLYKGGNSAPLQMFLIISTCFLYLVAAGLFSKAVWSLEMHKACLASAWAQITGGDAAATGSGPGSYDIRQSVWHVNCCNAEINGGGGWGIFNAILGWENSATYGSVISYNVYWIFVICCFLAMNYNETHGYWPLMRPRTKSVLGPDDDSERGMAMPEKAVQESITVMEISESRSEEASRRGS